MKFTLGNIKFVLLCLAAFMLTCYIYWAPIVIVAFVVVWLAEGNLKYKLTAWLHNKYAILFIAFYLIHVLGMVYTSDVNSGWFDLQVKLSLLVFPVVLVSEGKMDSKKQRTFVWSFIAGLIVNGLICLGYAIWKYFALGLFEFQYSQFSIFLHPSYFSMYIDMAVVFIFYILTESGDLGKREKILFYIAFFFLEFIIVLLQSKAGLIVSSLVIIVGLVRYLMKESPRAKTILLLGAIAGLYYVSYHYIITSGRSRILSARDILMKDQISDTTGESTQVRLYVWKAGLEIVKRKPLLGTGTGASRGALVKEYEKDGMTGALEKKLNAHNQYIQCALSLGIPGLLLFLFTLLWPLYMCYKEKRFVYAAFICIFMINILVESMLETQGGTMFYGLFNSLLMFNFVI